MFPCSCGSPQTPHSKYAFCLLGPPTRVLLSSEAMNEAYDSVENAWRDEQRGTLADRLSSFEQAQLLDGQIIRFSWGEHDSPVHAEPDCTDTDRVFVSLLFGNEDEIRKMCEWRSAEYGKKDLA